MGAKKGDSNAINPHILGGRSYAYFDCRNGPCFSRSADRTDSDAQRAAYLKRFYGVGDELTTHYDLALNSDSLSVELMTDLVVRAVTAL